MSSRRSLRLFIGLGVATALMPFLLRTTSRAAQAPAVEVAIDNDDIGGVVRSAKGPEAGVWVIAETTELPTKFAKIVVTDGRGRLITNLIPEHFEVVEDGQPQTIRLFTAGIAEREETPLRLGVLLDVSGSMSQDLASIRSASINFISMLGTAEDVTIVDFDSEVRSARFDPQDPRLVERIRGQKVGMGHIV